MCGITGIISLNNASLSEDLVVKMTDELLHRGPDNEGFLITNNSGFSDNLRSLRPQAHLVSENHRQQLAFGHRRLSIVDLSDGASQPMTDFSQRYYIVFNGEIYNHRTLREELMYAGYKFNSSHSDTEVILNAYDYWGIDCLQKFNGMWAFCIWDKKENTFFLSRDRAGKKPLYYTTHNECFYFASELKAILVNKNIPKELNDKGIYDYLTYVSIPAPATVFNNIYKLPAAHYMVFKPGDSTIPRRYWTPFTNLPYYDLKEDQIMEGLRQRVYEAARIRMVADVEVGVLLSGGIDSSVSLACLNKYNNKPIKAFSVGFENKAGYKNEFEYARKVAKLFNAEYHELTLTDEDFINFFPEMVYYQDEPIADTANIPIYYIAQKARENNVKVLLGGEGSDELFVGYSLWKMARDFALVLENRPALARMARFIQKQSPLKNRRLYYYHWYEKILSNQPVFWGGTELRSEGEKEKIISKDFLQRLSGYNSFEPLSGLYKDYSENGNGDVYGWMSASDLQYRLPDYLLARLDRMLMAASVEGRNPFLDVNVMEFTMRIPPHMKTSQGQEKLILKKAFEGILPNEILYRNKDSFTVPLKSLFNNRSLMEMTCETILKFNNKTGYFNSEYIGRLIENPGSKEFWNISNLALWHSRFCN